MQKSPSLKNVTATALQSWWSSACHVTKSQESESKLMLDWQSVSKFFPSFCWPMLLLHQTLCNIYKFLPEIHKTALVTEPQSKVPKTLVLGPIIQSSSAEFLRCTSASYLKLFPADFCSLQLHQCLRLYKFSTLLSFIQGFCLTLVGSLQSDHQCRQGGGHKKPLVAVSEWHWYSSS